MGSSSEHVPARRTWRREKDEPWEPNAPAHSHSGRKTKRPTSERSDIEGVWGALPPSSLGHDHPRRQARASVVPLLAECLSLPLRCGAGMGAASAADNACAMLNAPW